MSDNDQLSLLLLYQSRHSVGAAAYRVRPLGGSVLFFGSLLFGSSLQPLLLSIRRFWTVLLQDFEEGSR